MKCGIPEHGFIRLHCNGCGHDDLVAFSCKKRGASHSCSARAAADGAAHLVDRVLPRVPWRQWVVSWPFELGGKLAFQPDVLRACERVATDTIRTWMNARSGGNGNGGGVSVRHRFGSTMNLHVHLHLLVMDGGYSPDGCGGYVFNAAAAVTQEAFAGLARTLREKVQRAFTRRGLLARDEVNNEGERLDALMMCGRPTPIPTRAELWRTPDLKPSNGRGVAARARDLA